MILLLYTGRIINLVTGIIFLAVSLTDIVDGYLARKYDIVTDLGKILDPLADKLMVLAALIMLIPSGRLHAWIVVLIVIRETGITSLRAVAASQGIVISASPLGKYKNMFQVIATLFLIIHYNYDILTVGGLQLSIDFHRSGMLLMWVALVFTLWSGIDYFVKFFRQSVDL